MGFVLDYGCDRSILKNLRLQILSSYERCSPRSISLFLPLDIWFDLWYIRNMKKLYSVFATERDGNSYRGIDFLVEAYTPASAYKQAFRILKDEWDCADETEVGESLSGEQSLLFPNDCFIELKSIQVEEITAEEFVKRHIRKA